MGAAILILFAPLGCSAPSGCRLVVYCAVLSLTWMAPFCYGMHCGGGVAILIYSTLGVQCMLRVYYIIHWNIRAPQWQCTHKDILMLVPDWLKISRDNPGAAFILSLKWGENLVFMTMCLNWPHDHLTTTTWPQPQPLDHNHNHLTTTTTNTILVVFYDNYFDFGFWHNIRGYIRVFTSDLIKNYAPTES